MAEPRVVAGLNCMEVLANLSEFVDGDLSPILRQQILEHVAGCNWCEEFGGHFSSLVATLRSSRPAAEELEDSVAERLQQFLAERLER